MSNDDAPATIYRFADPEATETFEVEGCHCPAGIHKVESVTIRTQLGAGEKESIQSAAAMAGEEGEPDLGVLNTVVIVKSVTEWSLLTNEPCYHPNKPHKKNEPLGISRRTVNLLDAMIREAIKDHIGAAAQRWNDGEPLPIAVEEPPALPNGSGARSRASSRASASPTPTAPPPA